MRIAILGSRSFPARYGGLEVVVQNVATQLAHVGHDVDVYVSQGAKSVEPKLDVTIARSFKGKYLHTASQLFRSVVLLRRNSPDVVHIHGVGPAFVLLIWPKFFSRQLAVVTCHGLDWNRTKWPAQARWLFKRIALAALRRADGISAVSRTTSIELEAEVGRPVEVISNGFEPIQSIARCEVPLPPKYSVSLSRLTPEKNIEMQLQSYDSQAESVRGPLVVVGGGASSYAEGYERQLKREASLGVLWLGALEQQQALAVLKGASLFISMSKLEAQPMAVLEAMALEIPMILSDIPAHREIAEGVASFVTVGDTASLTSMLAMGGTPDLTRLRRGKDRVASMGWEGVSKAYEDWYSVIAAQKNSRR